MRLTAIGALALSCSLIGCGLDLESEDTVTTNNSSNNTEEENDNDDDDGKTEEDGKKKIPDVNPDTDHNLFIIADSITTGIFADTELGETIDDENHTFIKGLEALIGQSEILAFMQGDLTITPNEAQAKMGRPELTAFASEKDWAFAKRIRDKTGLDNSYIHSYATVGASYADTADHDNAYAGDQIAAMEELLADLKTTPNDVVVVELGGNDLCRSVPANVFAAEAEAHIRKIATLLPDARILVSAVPNVPEVTSLTEDMSSSATVTADVILNTWGIPTFGDVSFTCEELREIFNQCDNAHDDAGLLPEYNTALETLVDELSAEGIKIAFGAEIADPDFYQNPEAIMSGDCFHPSEAGQQVIARELWPNLESLFD